LPTPVQDSPLARKLSAYVALFESEFAILATLHKRRRTFPAGLDLIYQGQSERSAYILARGWVSSYKLLPGGTRQIVDFQIPGDFLGLRSALFRTADHNIEPVTEIEASEVIASDLIDAFSRSPRCFGQPRATKRWGWSTWLTLAAGMRSSAPRISCWNWVRG
jgi:CRP-like cAMP-binding protein